MTWTKIDKAIGGSSAGWGDLAWGDGAWGSPQNVDWSKVTKASNIWTLINPVTDSWTKQTKAS